MYERPPTTPFQNPPQNTTFPFQRYTLEFQQHQDESIYDAWTHVKSLIQRVPHHGLVITEYFVKISKRRAFWSLNEDILKITVLTTNTPYPSRKIRRIRACTHQRPQRKQVQYTISSEDQYAILEI
ncbi:hypothetical protein Tco_0129009 [Tanacetum coccineum]